MPANIEIKARVSDFVALKRRVESLSDTPVQVIPQEDIFFNVENGRLKLRVFNPVDAQLIYYTRPDATGPKRSEYVITETSDPAGLKQALALAVGVRGVVKKTRYLYLAGQTRIHLDEVESLGYFLELEVVLQPDQSDAEGRSIARSFMDALGVTPADLIEGAYIDMIEESR